MTQVPLAPPPPTGGPIDGWLYLLWRRLTQAGQILWSSLDTSGSNLTDIETRNHVDLQNHNTTDYYHLTQANHTDLTDAGDSSLHYHSTDRNRANHTGTQVASTISDFDTEVSNNVDVAAATLALSADYLTLSHTNASLTGERAIAMGTGLSATDGGAGNGYTINPVAFVGDSGSGGFIGAVPSPSSGDGDASNRKYLCADGTWREIGSSSSVHNGLSGLEGGVNEGVFETGAFESTAFALGAVQFYHLTSTDYTALVNQTAVLTTAIDATLNDDAYICIVTASAKTITLPEAIPNRIGRQWTVMQNCNGITDVASDATDEIVLPGGTDTIRLDQIGSTVTLRCISSTQWVIV